MSATTESRDTGAAVAAMRRGEVAARLWREALLAGRFAVVGAAATLVHMLAAWLLIDKASLWPLLANLLAFLTAFGVSFTGHYRWTFGSPGKAGCAMRRFFLISGSAFMVNTMILAGLLQAGWLSPSIAAVLSAGVVPGITFVASRLWGFRFAVSYPGSRD